MIKRDTERDHAFSNSVFAKFNIYDLQGLLREGDVFSSGVEAYEVSNFEEINLSGLDQSLEMAKFPLCTSLSIPYFIIVTIKKSKTYLIFETKYSNQIEYQVAFTLNAHEFLDWWRKQQSFNQQKPMYNAGSRIAESIIDRDLFANSLAWGVNLDGFTLDKSDGKITAIFEERIRTYKPPNYSVENYDPNKFFHGTRNRAGDFSSWNILFKLSKELNVPLYLLTFDTSGRKIMGATIIENVFSQEGLTYKNKRPPCANLFPNDNTDFDNFLNQPHG